MATLYHARDGVITLSAGDTYEKERTPVESIILTAVRGGTFTFNMGNAEFEISTGSADLTKQIHVNRRLNSISLISGPSNPKMYILLKQS